MNTTPRQRTALFEAIPETAALARCAVRLHPRRATPSAEHSSAGGPLLWPQDEPAPVCTEAHAVQGKPMPVTRGRSQERPAADPATMASVLQLFRPDIHADHELLPGWMFPAGSDLLQILWCPNEHPDTPAPHAQMFWRDTRELHNAHARHLQPTLVGLDQAVPVPCLLHPELITELPPLTSVPAPLRARLSGWQHPDKLVWEDWSHYDALATAPGWKLGGWAAWVDSEGPAACACTADPTHPLISHIE